MSYPCLTRPLAPLLAVLTLLAGPAMAESGAETGADPGLPPLPAPLSAEIERARADCAGFENGQFNLEWGAVSRVDLDGDLYPDWVLDSSYFACSSAASLYCGTGGCMAYFLVGDTATPILTKGWQMTDMGPFRVLLTQIHGSECGGINPTPCLRAQVWEPDSHSWRHPG
ncbi:MAG: hypothetical protein R3D78_04885 [Paracoccaceae bacterium]